MSDLIDRQEAIAAVGYYSLHSGDKLLFADKPLKELPSAQPEQCSDCIANGGDWECDHMHCRKGRLPSAQPGITLESAVDYLHSIGWMQEHDRILTESAQPEIIRCKDCKHWTQSMGKMKGYGLGRCDFHDADLVTCNGYCYWAERRTDG